MHTEFHTNRKGKRATIQLYFGHSNIQNTVIYTQLASGAFQDLWHD